MPRDIRQTRRHILEQAYRQLYREGFQRTGVEAIAAAAGVTKRTLYNHFGSKDALIAAVMDAQADLAAAEIRRWSGDGQATPVKLIGRIFDGLRQWANDPDWRGSGFTRAAMELAWAPGHPARKAARVQKQAVEKALAEAFGKAGVIHATRLARELVVLIEGSNALTLIYGGTGWYDSAEEAARRLAGEFPARSAPGSGPFTV